MDSLLELKKVSKRFADVSAVRDIDLQILAGKNLVLVGPSGAGKSTLLRLVAGLEQPDTGSIERHPDLDKNDKSSRSVAMLSQDYALYPQQTVTQNLTTALRNLRLSKADVAHRINETLEWFGIQTLAGRLPSELSGGEAQRAAFAKALVARPKLLLLDEPLSQVDTTRKESLLALIRQSIEQFKLSSLIVTHDPVEALRLADEIAVIDQGQIVQQGPAREVYQHPNCQIAGDLLSPFGMNWFPAEKFNRILRSPNETLTNALKQTNGAEAFGFRPESVQLGPSVDERTVANLVGRLEHYEELGFALIAKIRVGTELVSALLPASTRFQIGQELEAHLANDDLYFVHN